MLPITQQSECVYARHASLKSIGTNRRRVLRTLHVALPRGGRKGYKLFGADADLARRLLGQLRPVH